MTQHDGLSLQKRKNWAKIHSFLLTMMAVDWESSPALCVRCQNLTRYSQFPMTLLSWQHTRWRLPIEMLMNELRLLERQITNNQMRTLTLNVIFVLTLLSNGHIIRAFLLLILSKITKMFTKYRCLGAPLSLSNYILQPCYSRNQLTPTRLLLTCKPRLHSCKQILLLLTNNW